MDKLGHQEVINLLLQLGIMLISARVLAELARKFKQPAVVGEILAGVLLGPTILGTLSPDLYESLFPMHGISSIVLDSFVQIAVVLLLFIAGLEVELYLIWQQGKQALLTSMMAFSVPFSIGFGATYFFPHMLGLAEGSQSVLVYALFIGTVLSITALPVVARILLDLEIFKTKMGMLVIASAMIIDILGWLIFTVILTMMDTDHGSSQSLGRTVGLTLGFTFFMLTIGRSIINKVLPWINNRLSWPGGLLALSLAFCFFAAAFTEFIGIHSIFGAFILGIALGDSEHLSERAKEIVHQFINNIFAPLFFVSIGLYINFYESFNLGLVLILLGLATITKVIGATFGARWGGLRKYDALAVGFAMNTHGTLEVILGAIALSSGLINETIFVAILTMIIITIIISSPLMKYCLSLTKNKI